MEKRNNCICRIKFDR